MIAGIQLGVHRQLRPPVLAHGAQKPRDGADVGAAGLRMRDLDGQPGQLGFQDLSIERARTRESWPTRCQL
jgi:hypothetical protein